MESGDSEVIDHLGTFVIGDAIDDDLSESDEIRNVFADKDISPENRKSFLLIKWDFSVVEFNCQCVLVRFLIKPVSNSRSLASIRG